MEQGRKTAVVTGGNSGIGFATARDLVDLGWRVVITGRDQDKLRAAADALASRGGGNVLFRRGDFASFGEVRALADALSAEPRIDLLLNNAGVARNRRGRTEDGNETILQVNHLSPFLLTNLLLGKLKGSAPARIVNVSSRSHRLARDFGFDDFQFDRAFSAGLAYGRTKLYNILFARELARRLEGTGVTANALHPGSYDTNIGKEGDFAGLLGFVWPFIQKAVMAPADAASRVTLFVATAPELDGVSGKYFGGDSREERPSPLAEDDAAARRLWEMSAELVDLA